MDNVTAEALKITGLSWYQNLTFSWGWFYNCSGENSQNVYGQITHTFNGNEYQMIAGTNHSHINGGNAFSSTLVYDQSIKQASWSFWDNQGGVQFLCRDLTFWLTLDRGLQLHE